MPFQSCAAGDRASALGRDSRNGRSQRLFRHRHVMGVGVEQKVCAGNPADVTFPEQEIAAAQRGIRGQGSAQRRLLQVGIAGTGDAAGAATTGDPMGSFCIPEFRKEPKPRKTGGAAKAV